MSKRQIAGIVLLASLTALAVILPFATTAQERRDFYAFEVELTSDRDGQAQVFFDVGRGINEADSFHQALPARAAYAVYRFPLPTGTLQGLRFDPIDREGRLAIRHAQIVSRFGDVVHQFVPADFRPARQIASLTINGDTLSLDTDRGATDPITELRLARPLPLPLTNSLLLRTMVPVAAGVFLGFLALALAATPLATDGRIARIRHWGEQRPLAWLAAAAAAGVALQCHPVVFFGRSFVSPDNAGFLLYDTFPTLPGYVSSGLEDAKGADVGATLYQHLYYPLEAHEALINDGELPLWNRFNLAGVPLLGQGQSTIGELMSLLPFFARSAAWAWDAKFILAHWAYGLGIGLAVFRLTRHPGVSALLAATAGYVGFFAFRINHPAQFSVCLAPWVLLAWFWVADARGWRSLGVALVAWVLANWELLTSGTIKEAYMIQVCVNFAGLLFLILPSDRPARERLLKLAAVAAAGAVFLLVSAPVWLVFLDTLQASRTSYDAPGAMQLPWWQFLGFFEDLFYRQLRPGETHANPSANLVVFAAILALLVSGRALLRDRRTLAVAIACLLPIAIIFGIIPASLLVRIPFIANIHHTDNTFSCGLLVLATILAGPGLVALLQRVGEKTWWVRSGGVIILAGLAAWVWWRHAGSTTTSAFFHGYIASLSLGLCIGIIGLAFVHRARGLAVAGLTAALVLLLWRHGQYLETPFDAYVFNPKIRADFRAPSAAVADVRARLIEPSRPSGIGLNLFSGFNQMLGWEGIGGVDALRNGSYDELVVAGGAKKVRWWDFPAGEWNETDLSAQLPLQDMLNVRYYLATHAAPAREIPGLRLLAQHDLDVYESATAWPRAFFTNQVTTHASLAGFIDQLRSGDRRPFASIVPEDAPGWPTTPVATGPGRVVRPAENYRLTNNTTAFRIAAPGPGYVVLTETYYPRDFRVTLDDQPVDYFRVNHAFKAIRIPAAGTYEVRFTYRPHHLTLALALAGAGWALLAAGLVASVLASRRQAGFSPLLAS